MSEGAHAVRRWHRERRWGAGSFRAFVAGTSLAELEARLAAPPRGDRIPGVRPRLAWFFADLSTDSLAEVPWLAMARALLAGEPAFQTALMACDPVVRSLAGYSVVELLTGASLPWPGDLRLLLFSVQVAVARTLLAWGLRPDAVFGHGLGEAAACVTAGILSVEEGARIIAAGPAAATESVTGWATGSAPGLAPRSTPRSASGSTPGSTPGSTVDLPAALELPLSGVAPRLGAIRMWSTVVNRFVNGAELDADYWARNLRGAARVAEAVATLSGLHDVRVVELGPGPIAPCVIAAARRHRGNTSSVTLATDVREARSRDWLEALAGRLWCDGLVVDWNAVSGDPRGPVAGACR